MEPELSDVVEHEGEIISRADATRAAEEMVESTGIVPTLTPEQRAIVHAYDSAAESVEERLGQGIVRDRAWAIVDPLGKIKRDFERLEQDRQDALNHASAEAIHRSMHDRRVAEIEQKYMYDPVKRNQAMRELLATERAQDERRGRRW